MIITYLRSSSESAWRMCGHRYFLEYILCEKQKTNMAACKGSICHKSLEGLALWKLAQQNSVKVEDELFGHLKSVEFTPKALTDLAYDYYSGFETHLSWTDFHRNECHKWVNKTLHMNGGDLDPRNSEIYAVETRFDIEFNQPWAKYDYKLGNEKIKGQFGIKGAIDLVIQIDEDTLLVRDWKTGQRKCWITGKPKTYDKLMEDKQLQLYYYAIRKTFPQFKHVVMSIVYINHGGEFILCFDDDTLIKTENYLRKTFETIKNTDKPKIQRGFYCRFCDYDKHNEELGMSKCEYFKGQVYELGAQTVTEFYGDKKSITSYGAGGGKQ